MKYLYVSDEAMKNDLLTKDCKLVQKINEKTWVFEMNPSLFNCKNIDMNTFTQNSKCFISNILKMTF